MRADRLIAALLVLQRRGKVTARELADELEVSERTARRDLESLGMSGVPVYSTHGRGGGWQLVGGATTDLTGLSESEARALFVALGRAGVGQLDDGIASDLSGAMRKLAGALPETFRSEATLATSAIRIDSTGWGQLEAPSAPEHLDALTEAVLAERCVALDYINSAGERGVRTVGPLGLVTKRGIWYLVATSTRGVRTYRISRVEGLELLDDPVERPDEFDLEATWREIVTEVEARRPSIEVRCLAHPSVMRALRWQFRGRLTEVGEHSDGRIEIVIDDYGPTSFAGQIAGHGNRIELVDPPAEVVDELSRLTEELSDMYGG